MFHPHWQALSLNRLQRIKKWHVANQSAHPLELHLFDGVLTVWVMSWFAWMPLFILGFEWLIPFSFLGLMLPNLYIAWRVKAHAQRRLRCDWVNLVT
jgi:uncharacterized membrane protein